MLSHFFHGGHVRRQEEQTRELGELEESLFSSLTGFLFSDEESLERDFQKCQQVDFLQHQPNGFQYSLN